MPGDFHNLSLKYSGRNITLTNSSETENIFTIKPEFIVG